MRFLFALLILALGAPAFGQKGILIVGNKGEDSVSFIDLADGRELKRAPAGKAPHEVAISPDGKRAAVVAYGGETIHIYDVATRAEVDRIDLARGARPHGIVWLGDGRIVASAEGSGGIVVASPGARWAVQAIPTGERGSHMVAVSPEGRFAYAANLGSGTISKIDLNAGKTLKTVPAGKGTEGIALSANGREVWASARESDRVFVFDARTMAQKAEIAVGRFPLRIVVSPDGRYAVTSNLADGTLSVIDVRTKKPVRTIRVLGGQDEGQVTLLFSADGKRLYAALTRINQVAEIDFATGERTRLLTSGAQGDGLAIAP